MPGSGGVRAAQIIRATVLLNLSWRREGLDHALSSPRFCSREVPQILVWIAAPWVLCATGDFGLYWSSLTRWFFWHGLWTPVAELSPFRTPMKSLSAGCPIYHCPPRGVHGSGILAQHRQPRYVSGGSGQHILWLA